MSKVKIATYIIFIIVIFFSIYTQAYINILFYLPLVLCIYYGNKEKNIFNPYFLFALTPLSILLYNPNINIYFLQKINITTYFIIFIGILSFLFGMLISKKVPIKSIQTKKIKTNRVYIYALILGLIPHFIGLLRVGIPILNIDSIEFARQNYLPQGLSFFIFFLPLTIVIAFYKGSKKLIFFSVLINLFFSVIRVAKFDFFIFLIFSLFSFLKYGTSIFPLLNKKVLILFIIILIPITFTFTYLLRSGSSISESQFIIENTSITSKHTTKLLDYISLPYFYLATPWSNFAFNVSQITEFNYGLYTLYPFLSALQLNDIIDYNSTKLIYQHPFNTFGFLTDFYMDFGIFGIIILPFLFGYIVFNSYNKSQQNNNPIIDGQFLILGIPTLFLFFSNHFTSVGYPFIVYLLYSSMHFVNSIKIKNG